MKALIFLLNAPYVDHSKDVIKDINYNSLINLAVRPSGPHIVANKFEENGIEAEVLDYVPYMREEELLQFFEKRKNDNIKFIGISANFATSLYIEEFIKKSNEYFPDAIKIVGGQRRFNEDLGADYYVSGFAEVAVPAIIRHELYGEELEYQHHHDGKRVETKSGKYQTHLLPDFQTYYKKNDYLTHDDVLSLEIGRGCKFKCDFCSFSLIGLKDRAIRNSNDIKEELTRNYELYGVTNYMLSDDTVNETTDRIRSLAEAVDGLNFTPTFGGFIRLDLVPAHKEHIELMAQARILANYYGIETFNRNTGKLVGKGADPEKVKDTMLEVYEYMMKNVGEYHGDVGMIIGLPRESIESLNRSHEWLKTYWGGIGQNVVWFPFSMDEDGVINSNIVENNEKYGYTLEEKNAANKNENSTRARKYVNELQWKNEHMSFSYATDILFPKFFDHWWRNNNVPLNFGHAMMVKSQYGSLNSLQDPKTEYNRDTFISDKEALIRNYIRQKIQ